MEYFVSGNYIYQEDCDLTDTIDIHRMLVSVGVKVAVRVMIMVRYQYVCHTVSWLKNGDDRNPVDSVGIPWKGKQ